MPRDIIAGDAGSTWTNAGERNLFQLLVSWHHSCGLCVQFDHQVGPWWPIPFHRACNCRQVPVFPGQTSRPFVDFREKIREVSPQQQAAIMGRANLTLVEAGVVDWSDVVTPGRVRSLREVASRNKLGVDAMVRAGVPRHVAEEAHRAVNTGEHTAAEARRKSAVDALLAKGYTRGQVRDAAGVALGSRLSIGEGPSGPSAITPAVPLTPRPMPPAVARAAMPGATKPPKFVPRPASEFRDFRKDPEGGDDDMKRLFSDWADALPDKQHAALAGYAGGQYEGMNALLRGDRDGIDDAYAARLREDIGHASAALEKSALPVPIVAYRGAAESAIPVPVASLKRGDRLDFAGFVSTTIDRDVAEGFAYGSHRGVIMEMRLPAGTKGAYLNAGYISPSTHEREFLMPPSAGKFRVVEVRPPLDTFGKSVIVLEAIP